MEHLSPCDEYQGSMQAIPVQVRRIGVIQGIEAELELAKAMARLMDAQFQLGGVKLGLDALLGLVPVVGDAVSLAIGIYPIRLAQKYNLGRTIILRMWWNLGVDFVGGLVPVVGDAVDVFIKSHSKNVALLEDACRRKGLIRKGTRAPEG